LWRRDFRPALDHARPRHGRGKIALDALHNRCFMAVLNAKLLQTVFEREPFGVDVPYHFAL
jgi:hypothetical protein